MSKPRRGRGAVAAILVVAAVACAVMLSGAGPVTSAAAFTYPRASGRSTSAALVTLDGAQPGPAVQGIGAISGGGGNSRLLVDYPPVQRSAILDYLFRPGYGAALQILKLEIGGDANSSAGAEPSIEHTPGSIDCQSGYEWWIAEQAVARNPRIALYGLQWAAPGWTGIWTSTDIRYILDWLGCARRHGLTISYIGGWNERRGFPSDWFVSLRQALDAGGFSRVKIVAADQPPGSTPVDSHVSARARQAVEDLSTGSAPLTADNGPWQIASDMAVKPALRQAVDVLGSHDTCGYPTTGLTCSAPDIARDLGRPLWESELGAMDANLGAPAMARSINNAFTQAGVTGILEWPLIASMPAGLPFENRGLITADQPWSGQYTVNLMTWAIAQTTQFVAPGWEHLPSASGSLPGGGSLNGYMAPDRSHWSLVTETTTATAPQTITVHLTGGLTAQTVHVWSTDLETAVPSRWFVRQADVRAVRGAFTYRLAPGYATTFTTTTGQGKGRASSPAPAALPLPYGGLYELPAASVPVGEQPRLLSAQDGAFQFASCGDGTGLECVHQRAVGTPVWWVNHPGNPYAVLGDPWSQPYTVAGDVSFTAPGQTAGLIGDFDQQAGMANPQNFAGYELEASTTGAWSLVRASPAGDPVTLASGQVNALAPSGWHRLALTVNGAAIGASIDGVSVADVPDATYTEGSVGIMTGGFYDVRFRDLSVTAAP